jgi:hypothetical protein
MPAQNPNFPHEEFDPDFDNITTADGGDGNSFVVDLPGPKADDVDLEIVDDTPEADRKARALDRDVAEPTEDELANYGQKARTRINELTHARHDERRKREAIEREHTELVNAARRMQEENARLRKAYDEGSQEYSKATVAAVEAEVKVALDKLRKANETLDPEEITLAQEALTDAKIKLVQAKNFRAPVVPTAESVVKTREATQPTAPADPKLASWMDANKWFTAPEHVAETSYALGLHQELVQKGYQAGSDAYYEQVDARMQKRFPELYPSGAKKDDEPVRRKTTSPVAQVERTPAGKRRVTLTQSQLNLCKKLNITPQQYAAEIASKGA